MYKILGIVVLLCVKLIIASPETEELKRKCLTDEEFPSDVNICSVRDGIAIFQFTENTITFRCISILLQNQPNETSVLTIKSTLMYELNYIGAVTLSKKTDEIKLKLFQNSTARIAIISFNRGFLINDVLLNNENLQHDWNCKKTLVLKEVCGKRRKVSTIDIKTSLSWPWVVAIYQYRLVKTTGRYKCGGSIITTKYVLTSGNGLIYEGRLLHAEELKVHVSRTSLNPHEVDRLKVGAFKIYKVNKIIQHEHYKFALENNIALLEVENFIEFSDFVLPICLPSSEREFGELGNVVGFAKNEWDYHPLEEATDSSYTLISREDCEKNTFLRHFKHVQTYCGTVNEKKMKIHGLGSGLYIQEKGKLVIGGIVSKASETDALTVFTDVFQYLHWIKSHSFAFST